MKWVIKNPKGKGKLEFTVVRDNVPPKTFLTIYRKGKRAIPCWERKHYRARGMTE